MAESDFNVTKLLNAYPFEAYHVSMVKSALQICTKKEIADSIELLNAANKSANILQDYLDFETQGDDNKPSKINAIYFECKPNRYRNFGVIAANGVGKTTITHQVLDYTNKDHSIGEVQFKTAVDIFGIESASQMAARRDNNTPLINNAITTFWSGRDENTHHFNIIDIPSQLNLSYVADRSLRVLDSAIVLLGANEGVELQTETVWRQANRCNLPRVFFVNKMDKVGADFYHCVDMIKKRLDATPLVVQLPIGAEKDFAGVVDLIEMKALVWKSENLGADWGVVDIPDDLKDKAEEYRELMIETAVEVDDDAMEDYLEGGLPDNDKLRELIRIGTIAAQFFPVLCGAALKNRGVHSLFDSVIDFLPSPLDVLAIEGNDPADGSKQTRVSSANEPLSLLAFKVMNDPYLGSLTFCRIYSGKLKTGIPVLNSTKNKKLRFSSMREFYLGSQRNVKEAVAGDIVVIVGLKEITVGDTLCDPLNPIVFESTEFPDPVIEIAIEPKTKVDKEKMGIALNRLAAEDPSFRVKSDEESGQTIIAGMGELHLDILVDRMNREFKVEANIGAPQAAYRETITREADIDYTHKKQSGSSGQFARVKIILAPNDEGEDFEFVSKIVGGNVPKEYIPGVEKGIKSVMDSGPVAGFPMLGVRATLYDGAYHDVDSSVLAFEIAARAAFRQGAKEAGAKLLEPIMKIEVETPEEYMGDVIGDFNSRRGQITGTEIRGTDHIVSAMVPLANMFGYVSDLNSISQGRAQYIMTFDHYSEVSNEISDDLSNEVARK